MGLKENLFKVRALSKVMFVDVPAAKWAHVKRVAKPGRTDIVLLDLDDTLLSTNSSYELLVQVVGENEAKERYARFRNLIKSGRLTLQEAQLEAHREMVNDGVTLEDYRNMVERVIRQQKVRLDVLAVMDYLRGIGKKVVLATKSSQVTADLFAEEFDFDGAIGTREKFSRGKLTEITALIGDKRSRTLHVQTKMERLKEWCSIENIPFSPRHVSVVTDSYDDYRVLREAGFGLLYIPKKAETHQKIAKKFGLSDVVVKEVDSRRLSEMKKALRFPKGTLRPRSGIALSRGVRKITRGVKRVVKRPPRRG